MFKSGYYACSRVCLMLIWIAQPDEYVTKTRLTSTNRLMGFALPSKTRSKNFINDWSTLYTFCLFGCCAIEPVQIMSVHQRVVATGDLNTESHYCCR